MIYQVKANLYFDELDEATDFYHDCELAFAKGIVVNPGSIEEEPSEIECIENHHDEDPNGACLTLASTTNRTLPPD